MNKQLPLYELQIDDDNSNDTGVLCVSLVDKPAILVDFLKFSADEPKMKFAIQDNALQIVSGPILIPNQLIFRNDQRGQYNVVATKEDIYKIVQKYARTQRPTNVNLEHGADGTAPGCYLFQSFIIDSALGINPPTQFSDLPDGTWFGLMKIDDPAIWASVVDGSFNGFSIEGFFDLVPKLQMSSDVNDMMIFSNLKALLDESELDQFLVIQFDHFFYNF